MYHSESECIEMTDFSSIIETSNDFLKVTYGISLPDKKPVLYKIFSEETDEAEKFSGISIGGEVFDGKRISRDSCEREVKCYLRIQKYNNSVDNEDEKINIPELITYGKLKLMEDTLVTKDFDVARGCFICMTNLEITRPYDSTKDFESVKSQRDLLHKKVGISLCDVRRPNIIIQGDKPYLIDFAFSEEYVEGDTTDLNALMEIDDQQG